MESIKLTARYLNRLPVDSRRAEIERHKEDARFLASVRVEGKNKRGDPAICCSREFLRLCPAPLEIIKELAVSEFKHVRACDGMWEFIPTTMSEISDDLHFRTINRYVRLCDRVKGAHKRSMPFIMTRLERYCHWAQRWLRYRESLRASIHRALVSSMEVYSIYGATANMLAGLIMSYLSLDEDDKQAATIALRRESFRAGSDVIKKTWYEVYRSAEPSWKRRMPWKPHQVTGMEKYIKMY